MHRDPRSRAAHAPARFGNALPCRQSINPKLSLSHGVLSCSGPMICSISALRALRSTSSSTEREQSGVLTNDKVRENRLAGNRCIR